MHGCRFALHRAVIARSAAVIGVIVERGSRFENGW
jgi:hypothetical protein